MYATSNQVCNRILSQIEVIEIDTIAKEEKHRIDTMAVCSETSALAGIIET